VVAAVALCAVVCPLADAWVCRRAEFAADRFAADRGLALELAAALRALHDGSDVTAGWSRRLSASHPSVDLRIKALATAPRRVAKADSPRCVLAATAQDIAGEDIQQPVQQRGSNDGVPRWTAADAAGF
jgi:hypothetical protein